MDAIIRVQKRPKLYRACGKKRMKKLPSLVHAVMSNDDLLIKILLRLPVTSPLVFRFVSKHWLSLTTDTHFTQRRSQFKIDSPSGLLLDENVSDLVSLDSGIVYSLQNNFLSGSIVEQSCNGLLLCRILPDKLYVYNPTINMFKMLPEQHRAKYDPGSEIGGVRLAFDPTKSPHYKVVHAGLINDEVIQIQIYSLETCNWSDHGDQFPSSSFDCFNNGIYWNGSINWLNKLTKEGLLYFKLDITHHPVLTTMENLRVMDGNYFRGNLFESRGYLLFLGTVYRYPPSFANVYEMSNGPSGWSLRYVVDFAKFPTSVWVHKNVWWVVLAEKEEDSYMIIRFDGDVREIQYGIRERALLFETILFS